MYVALASRLFLRSYPNSLVPCHSKRALLWQFNEVGKINVFRSSYKLPEIFSRFQPELKFLDIFSLSLQYQISRKSVQQDVGYLRRILRRPIGVARDTCGQTDMTKLKGVFRDYANAPKRQKTAQQSKPNDSKCIQLTSIKN